MKRLQSNLASFPRNPIWVWFSVFLFIYNCLYSFA